MCQRASKQAYLIYRHNWYMALPVGSTKTENKQTSFMGSRSFHWANYLRLSFSKGTQTVSKITFQWLEIYCAACLQLLWSSVLALGSPHERMAAKLSIASALEFWARRKVCNLPANFISQPRFPMHHPFIQPNGMDMIDSSREKSLPFIYWSELPYPSMAICEILTIFLDIKTLHLVGANPLLPHGLWIVVGCLESLKKKILSFTSTGPWSKTTSIMFSDATISPDSAGYTVGTPSTRLTASLPG